MLTIPLILTPRVVVGVLCVVRKVIPHPRKGARNLNCSFSLPEIAEMACSAAAGLRDGFSLPRADVAEPRADVAPPRPRSQSLFRAALQRIPHVKDARGIILTDGFLDLCRLTLPLIDSFGPAFGIVRNDISANIARIRRRQASDPARFALLHAVVLDEVDRRADAHPQSCTKAVLWLKRGMEFMVAIMRELLARPDAQMGDAVARCYRATIHRWHGFLASSAFSFAFNFIPSRDAFLERLGGGAFDGAAEGDMAAYVDTFGGLLAEVHRFLDKNGLDDPRKV